MWGSPIKTKGEDGQTVTLLIIDTEGTGERLTRMILTTTRYSLWRFFSLPVSFTTQWGRSMRMPFNLLNLVLNLNESIHQHSAQEKIDGIELPSFYWVVRDFSLQLIDQSGKHITSKEYLENALGPAKGDEQRY